ncbi:MAG: DUF3021 domain-containing protein [Coriobacteriales bacterium]|jgi:hypothetical protein|nr:DUF3021 domain-containing protein [Coriobacteriales bacterium]
MKTTAHSNNDNSSSNNNSNNSNGNGGGNSRIAKARSADRGATNIRKAIITRTLLGFPLGIAIGVVILLGVSFAAGDGRLHPVTPAMLAWMPDELTASFWQFVLCGILGAACSGSSPIFEIGHWSLTRQTVVHFLVLMSVLITVASVCGWTSPAGFSFEGTLLYLAIAALVYLVIWTSMTLYWRNWVKKANARLK